MIDYKAFIEDNFLVYDKTGELVPLAFNSVQDEYYRELCKDYPNFEGIRENDLKGRQFGLSTFWTAIMTTDFIMSSLGEIPMTSSDVYSYKDDATDAHAKRISLFIDSWILKTQGGDYRDPSHRKALTPLRREFLKIDSLGEYEAKNGTHIKTQTASAKVSGRGDTVQNIHWTEPAFYPNTEIMSAKKLMVGAEKMVPPGRGKIVRESTGNLASDYFAKEFKAGEDGLSGFKSRFFAWYTYKGAEYAKAPPDGWVPPEYYRKILGDKLATIEQVYWHYEQTRGLDDKEELREYPTRPIEAFLLSGTAYFDSLALLYYRNNVREPIKEVDWIGAL